MKIEQYTITLKRLRHRNLPQENERWMESLI